MTRAMWTSAGLIVAGVLAASVWPIIAAEGAASGRVVVSAGWFLVLAGAIGLVLGWLRAR